MATDFKSIPLIDIGPLLAKSDDPNMIEDAAVADVVRQLDRACREAGFFYVKGHGIPDSLIEQARKLSHRFFQLPREEKLKIKLSSATGYRGYQDVGQNITKGVPDQLEAVDFYRETKPGTYGDIGKSMEGLNLWPSNPPEFKPLMEEYIDKCTDLARRIMQGIALALGGSPCQFEGNIAGEPFWLMRPLGYPGLSTANGLDRAENHIGCYHGFNYILTNIFDPMFALYSGTHTDYGLLALLNQDEDITALQVRNLSGEWIWAPPMPGTLVCNIGDMLKILSNGLYESTVHRVINNNPKYRVCVGYFYETNFDAVIEPLDMCVKKSGGVKKLGTAVYGEHLVSKVKNNFRY